MPLADLQIIPHWSFSLIELADKCEFQTLQVRIIKSVKDDGGEALVAGQVVHSIIEDAIGKGVPVPESHAYLRSRVEPILALKDDRRIKIYVEHEMAVNRDLQPCSWFGPKTWGRAKTDVLAIEDKLATALDWKTGKPKPETAIEQLKLNALFVFWHFQWVQKVVLAAVWLSGNPPPPTTLVVDRSEMAAIWGEFQTRLQPLARAYTTSDWRKIPGPYCKWCPVLTCPNHPK